MAQFEQQFGHAKSSRSNYSPEKNTMKQKKKGPDIVVVVIAVGHVWFIFFLRDPFREKHIVRGIKLRNV